MATDARARTKAYLETNITDANLVKDDGATQVNYIVAYGRPDYPLETVFTRTDLVFSIDVPESEALFDTDQVPFNYHEQVPIEIYCIDKQGITGTVLKATAETELRLVFETYPTGSQLGLHSVGDNDQNLGSFILYSKRFIFDYDRNLTI